MFIARLLKLLLKSSNWSVREDLRISPIVRLNLILFVSLAIFSTLTAKPAMAVDGEGYWGVIQGNVHTRIDGDNFAVGCKAAKLDVNRDYPSPLPRHCELSGPDASYQVIYGGSCNQSGQQCFYAAWHYCPGQLVNGIQQIDYLAPGGVQCKPVEQNSCPKEGEPVIVQSGRVVETVTDWQGESSNRLKIQRNYSSFPAYTSPHFTSRFGQGWTSNFDSSVVYQPSNLTLSAPSVGSLIRIATPSAVELDFQYNGVTWLPVHAKSSVSSTNLLDWNVVSEA